jgi:hypothetical protein
MQEAAEYYANAIALLENRLKNLPKKEEYHEKERERICRHIHRLTIRTFKDVKASGA